MTRQIEHEPIELIVRPLGALSDYVVEELPHILTDVRAGNRSPVFIADYAERQIGTLEDNQLHRVLATPYLCEKAAFDLKVLEMAVAHHGAEPGPNLVRGVEVFSLKSGQPPSITYEEIIEQNGVDERRFTTDSLGAAESRFYGGHRIIEGTLQGVINGITTARHALVANGKTGVEEATAGIHGAVDMMDLTGTHMQRFRTPKEDPKKTGHLEKADLNRFREYLGTHPKRGLKGPSGAFSARVPLIGLYLGGETMSEEHRARLVRDRIYFPRAGRMEMVRAERLADQGLSLTALAQEVGRPQELVDGIEKIEDYLRRFRGQHLATVRDHIPDAIAGRQTGTGGEEDPGTFLRSFLNPKHSKI